MPTEAADQESPTPQRHVRATVQSYAWVIEGGVGRAVPSRQTGGVGHPYPGKRRFTNFCSAVR